MSGSTFNNAGDYRGSLNPQGSAVDNRGGVMAGTYVNVTAGNAELYAGIVAEEIEQGRLKAAETLLADLPLKVLPVPSALLPKGTRMPLRRNPLFVGRESDLLTLARTIKAGETAAVGQVAAAATGLGGIGKTQLAAEFVYRYGRFFTGGVLWLSFAEPGTVPNEVALCGDPAAMGLWSHDKVPPQSEQIARVLSAWCSPLPRLLVFDNCEDLDLLERWRPRYGGCRVLLTSRRPEWRASIDVTALTLGVLNPAESRALLSKHRPDLGPEHPDLAAIAGELGHLPLALHLVGSYLERYRDDPEGEPKAYLDALRRPDLLHHLSLISGDATPTGHERHVANTFALSHRKLDLTQPVDALARRLLMHAACFAPGEPIPRAILRLTLEAEPGGSGLPVSDAIGRAVELGLLERQRDGALTLHRLLAAFLRQQASEALAPVQDSVEKVIANKAQTLNNAGFPAPLAAWVAHLRAVADNATERGSPAASWLLDALGTHLRMTADLSAARTAFERALKMDEGVFGPEHPNVAACVSNLGRVLNDLGDLQSARAAFERALAIEEAVFGPEHPNVAACVNNLGLVLKGLGDLPGARAAFERGLKIDEMVFGPEHPNVALRLNNLGCVLQDLGDLSGARAAFERALKSGEAVFGPEHPTVAIRVNNLGGVLKNLGDLPGAQVAFERALKIDEAVFGPENPNVAVRLSNLGCVLHDLGNLPGAQAAFERALKIDEAVFGPEHPNVAVRLSNLGCVLNDLGDLPGARAAFERAFQIEKRCSDQSIQTLPSACPISAAC